MQYNRNVNLPRVNVSHVNMALVTPNGAPDFPNKCFLELCVFVALMLHVVVVVVCLFCFSGYSRALLL